MANKTVSVIQSGSNNYLSPALAFNRLTTDLVTPGVIGAITNTTGVSPATGSFAVNAQGSPNMTVAVTGPSQGYVSATPTGGQAQTYGVTSDVAENVTINNNASGSTVYDFVYIQLGAAALNTPDTQGLAVASYITSRSTTPYSAGGANNGNSNGAIANALLLAVVTVTNGAVSIVNANITDARLQTAATASARLTVNPIKFNVTRTAAWTAGNAVQIRVPFDTKSGGQWFDTGNNIDIVTNVGRFTAPVAGFYYFSANVNSNITATQIYLTSLYKNGAETLRGIQSITTTTAGNYSASVSGLLQLAANDYVEVFNYATGGVGATGALTYFNGFLVSTT